MVKGVKLCRAWNYDIVRYADGTVADPRAGAGRQLHRTPSDPIPTSARSTPASTAPSGSPPIWSRWGRSSTRPRRTTPGSAALDPDNPHTIYISTIYRSARRHDQDAGKREICEGVTCDNGATFTWTPLTARSTMDNIRPIVPKWDANHTALVWLRGTYTSAQSYV